jgi:hypothetical protein
MPAHVIETCQKIRSWDTGCIQSVILMEIPQSLNIHFFPLFLQQENHLKKEGWGHTCSHRVLHFVRIIGAYFPSNLPHKKESNVFSLSSLNHIAFVFIPLPLSIAYKLLSALMLLTPYECSCGLCLPS